MNQELLNQETMTQTEKRIIEEVEAGREDFVQFFRKLVMTKSFTKQEQEVAQLLAEGLKERGMKDVRIMGPEPDRPNVVAVYEGIEDGPTCTFNGHLDVLPPQEENLWPHKPFAGDIEDGKLYGRGTVDMKSGTFSSFFAGLVLERLQLPIRGRVVFTGVCDELVCGDQGILYLLKEGVIRKEHPEDFGINCEPTNLEEMNMATKGVMRADVTVIGKGAFNARPYLGVSAIDQSAKFIQSVQRLNADIASDPAWSHPLLEPRSVQVAMIQGGEASNLVPERVKMTVTRRLHPGETLEDCMKDYEEIFETLHGEDEQFRAEIRPWDGFRPPVEVPMDTPVAAAVARALKLVTGKDLALTGSEGGTDASHVVAQTGIPMPVFGPGDHRLLGTVDECVPLDDFIDAIKIYALTVYYMLGI